MTIAEAGLRFGRSLGSALATAWNQFGSMLKGRMPQGLYARSLLIIVTPMVLLQAVVAFVFMERHWQTVTYRLSAGVTQNIAAIIDVYKTFPQDKDAITLRRIAMERLGLTVDFRHGEALPPPGQKPFLSLVDQALSREIRRQIGKPFWMDTVGNSNLLEIRIQVEPGLILQVFARRNQAYASNSHIFLLWMVGTSLVLVAVAVAFLRNQIRPIQALAEAAESFGKGRDVEGFRPRGAREVRQASRAFLEMKRRIERQIDQRTTMLAGVSHDLRTVLTRFKLELALLEDNEETEAMRKDVAEMTRMLEDYLAFARGDSGEQAAPTDMAQLLETLRAEAERTGDRASVTFTGDPVVTVRPDAFKRLLHNLVANASRFADTVVITAARDQRWFTVMVDDDGPGIPLEQRDEVFRPFLRLDNARNQNQGGSGLGLAIARDIARNHGGDIALSDSPLGGLRAQVRIPV